SASTLQRKPSMPTMSTVSFQSPALPTISHLPVTVTGAFDSLVVVLVFEFVDAAGVFAGAGLFAGVFELTATLPEQPNMMTARDSARASDTFFMRCSSYIDAQT